MFLIPILRTDGQGLVENPVRVPATVLKGSGDNNTCPAEQDTIRSKSQLRQNISTILAGLVVHDCGGTPGWRRVGYLDMTDPSQSCPSGLAFKNYTSNVRSCGRASTAAGCWSTFYNTGGSQYSRVCGRVRGYQFGATSAFYYSGQGQTLNGYYVAGVSLTHGPISRRTHIWTFAAGIAETYGGSFPTEHCTCVTTQGLRPPSYVGNDYFCESGLNSVWIRNQYIFYPDDPLWDGQNCASNCCQLNNPPYFTKTLPAPTTNRIELRICSGFSATSADIPIDQVELYIQ